jgi:hypothetical protein
MDLIRSKGEWGIEFQNNDNLKQAFFIIYKRLKKVTTEL